MTVPPPAVVRNMLAKEADRPEIPIGGQAVMEGVVMRGPESWAVAVRAPDGEIRINKNPLRTLAQKYPRLNTFPLRGIFVLVDSLVIGMKSLSISARIVVEDEEGETLSSWHIALSLVLGLALFLGLFIVLPTVLARLFDRYLTNTIVYNLFEGLIRIVLFIAYLLVISLIPDVKRMFEYHGAEHKTVHAYEAGLPLTPSFAQPFSTAHIRCGTTFILLVLVISILVFSLLGRPALWLRILSRLAVLPFVAMFS